MCVVNLSAKIEEQLLSSNYHILQSLGREQGSRCSSVVRAFAHGAMDRRIDPSCGEPIELFLVPASAPRLVYPVCGMVYIKEPLLLMGKSSLCGGSGFPFSLSEWSLTICLTPYNRK